MSRRIDPYAAVRGVLVGAVSAICALAAHGAAMAAMHPMTEMATLSAVPGRALPQLIAACAVVGAVATAGRPGLLGLSAAVTVGQGAGHVVLGLSMGHLQLGPGMAAAHVAAALLAGLLILGAEQALRLAGAALTGLRRAPLVCPTVPRTAWSYTPAARRALTGSGALRGPPR